MRHAGLGLLLCLAACCAQAQTSLQTRQAQAREDRQALEKHQPGERDDQTGLEGFGVVVQAYGPRAPFVAAAILAAANMLYGLFIFPETLPPERRRIGRLAAPTSLVAALQVFGQLAETWLAARQGTAALAAWAVVLPFALLMQQASAGAMGGGVVSAVARALGAKSTLSSVPKLSFPP